MGERKHDGAHRPMGGRGQRGNRAGVKANWGGVELIVNKIIPHEPVAPAKKKPANTKEQADKPSVEGLRALQKAEKGLAFALEVVCSYEEGGECSESGEFIKSDLAEVRAEVERLASEAASSDARADNLLRNIEQQEAKLRPLLERHGFDPEHHGVFMLIEHLEGRSCDARCAAPAAQPATPLREVLSDLERVRKSLHEANESGLIGDVLWAGPAETTFDALDGAIAALRSRLDGEKT